MPSVPTFQIINSDGYVIESSRRFNRRWSPGNGRGLLLLSVFYVLLVIVSVIMQDWGHAALFLFAGIFFFYLGRIWELIHLMHFRKSPYRNEDLRIELRNDLLRMVGSMGNRELAWTNYTCVARFDDGILLFKKNAAGYLWLPFAGLTEGTPEEVDDRIRTKISDLINAI